MTGDTVFAVASGKGGVGKTTTTVNLGTALAAAGHRVAIVDADLGMANLAGFVNLSPDDATLHDVLAGDVDVESATYEVADGIVVVPSGTDLERYADVDAAGLPGVIDQLREAFDYVLLDVGAGVSHETVLPLGIADSVLVVVTPEPGAVTDAEKTVDLVDRADGVTRGLVLNKTRPNDGVSEEDIAAHVGVDLLAAVPEDPLVRESLQTGTPLVAYEPDSPASIGFRALAASLVDDVPAPDRSPMEALTQSPRHRESAGEVPDDSGESVEEEQADSTDSEPVLLGDADESDEGETEEPPEDVLASAADDRTDPSPADEESPTEADAPTEAVDAEAEEGAEDPEAEEAAEDPEAEEGTEDSEAEARGDAESADPEVGEAAPGGERKPESEPAAEAEPPESKAEPAETDGEPIEEAEPERDPEPVDEQSAETEPTGTASEAESADVESDPEAEAESEPEADAESDPEAGAESEPEADAESDEAVSDDASDDDRSEEVPDETAADDVDDAAENGELSEEEIPFRDDTDESIEFDDEEAEFDGSESDEEETSGGFLSWLFGR